MRSRSFSPRALCPDRRSRLDGLRHALVRSDAFGSGNDGPESGELYALARRMSSIDSDVLAALVNRGALGPLGERAAMVELACRVIVDDIECSADGLSHVPAMFVCGPILAAGVALGLWFALFLGWLE